MKFDSDKFIFNDELFEIENFYNTGITFDVKKINDEEKYHKYKEYESHLTDNYHNSHYDYEVHPYKHFLSAKEGFLRGNMIKNEFKPYKNYTYLPLVPKTKRDAKLLPVYEYEHAINDLNLYLDLNPNDTEAFDLFKKYVIAAKKARHEFESLYGPLFLESTLGPRYNWSQDPWPWNEDGGSKYV